MGSRLWHRPRAGLRVWDQGPRHRERPFPLRLDPRRRLRCRRPWLDGLLVGVSRAITDFAFCTYLSDLAVDEKYQRQGIGRELIRRTHEAAGLHTTLILLAAPKAQSYYPHIGMTRHESCWITAPQ